MGQRNIYPLCKINAYVSSIWERLPDTPKIYEDYCQEEAVCESDANTHGQVLRAVNCHGGCLIAPHRISGNVFCLLSGCAVAVEGGMGWNGASEERSRRLDGCTEAKTSFYQTQKEVMCILCRCSGNVI